MTFIPLLFKSEAYRIFKALNCEEISLDEEYKGTPDEIINSIQNKINLLNKEESSLKKNMDIIAEKNKKQ